MSKVSKFQAVSIACGAVAATAFGGFAQSASAAEEFNNQNIQFDRDTIVEFQFLGSKNRAQSTFGVVNLSTGEKTPLIAEVRPTDVTGSGSLVGSPSRAVRKPFAEYTFQSNTPYAFYLESKVKGKTPVTVYSVPDKNGGTQLAKFDNDATALGSQGVTIAWNDGTSSNKSSFDQFTVVAGGGVGCPCKASPALTAPLEPDKSPTIKRRPRAKG